MSFDTPGIFAMSTWDIASWMDALVPPEKQELILHYGMHNQVFYLVPNPLKGWDYWRIGILDRAVYWNASVPLKATVAEEEEVSLLNSLLSCIEAD